MGLWVSLACLTSDSINQKSSMVQQGPTQHFTMSNHLFIVAQQWEYRRHTDKIWDDTFGSSLKEQTHFPPKIFFSTNEMSHVHVYWPIKSQQGHHVTGGLWSCQSKAFHWLFWLLQYSAIVDVWINDAGIQSKIVVNQTLDLLDAFKMPSVMDKNCWLIFPMPDWMNGHGIFPVRAAKWSLS